MKAGSAGSSRPLPSLAPLRDMARPLSTVEYYHACVGTSGRTLEAPRTFAFVMEGDSTLKPEQWQWALEQVATVNPGTRLRLHGTRRRARWGSDGEPPRLRMIDHCTWDGRSEQGASFIFETPLPLEAGVSIELIVASRPGGGCWLILHGHHAVMDGRGTLHFLAELFRALRGEPLLGSNAAFSDVDLMRSLGVRLPGTRRIEPGWLTGEPQGRERGDEWRRVSIERPRPGLLAHVAVAAADFARQHSQRPVIIAVPVDLRRHAPGLISTTNFSSMLHVRVEPGDGAEHFNDRLRRLLESRREAVYLPALELLKCMPLSWLDRLVSRTPRNYARRKAVETALISNLGRQDASDFECPGFQLHSMMVIPLPGSAFMTMVGIGDRVDLAINLPKVLASGGRFDAFEAYLRQRLQD